MPSIPVNSALGYVGVFLVLFGFFLVLAGLNIIKVEKVSVTPGTRTWFMGIILAIFGILFLLPDILSTVPLATSTPPATVAVSMLTPAQLTPTDMLVSLPDTSTPEPATTTATPTNIPTPIPTDTPSPAPTSSPTPIPDTQPDTVLKPGETWRQGGMAAKLEKYELDIRYCGDVIWGADFWGNWQLVIENNTGQDLIANLEAQDFFLVDNYGNWGGPWEKEFGFTINTRNKCTTDKFGVPLIKNGEEMRFFVFGVGKIENQQWFQFGITELGPIKNAVWQIDLPR